jgi:hypothetical protein
MLLGAALALANELGISDQNLQSRGSADEVDVTPDFASHSTFLSLRRRRQRRLLYIYINQLALRHGWFSTIPRFISDAAEVSSGGESETRGHNIMTLWISLTRIWKTANDMLFTRSVTSSILQSGNYIASLGHFKLLLEDWNTEYLKLAGGSRKNHFRNCC